METHVTILRMRKELSYLFDGIDSDAVVLHTDVLRIGLFQRSISPRQQLVDFFSSILEFSEGCTLLFPTFNYDFCRTGVYNVKSDPCQVGTLNEYVRQLYPDLRSQTPIFNFCIYNNRYFSFASVNNPFSNESTFGELVKHRSTIAFLGASFASNTFTHHVEEIMNIGYRYIKPFHGIINFNDKQEKIVLYYRVRPLIIECDYDWERLTDDLLTNGIMRKSPLGNGQLLYFRADHLWEYWCTRLRGDELYLLTPISRARVEKLFVRYGKPLLYEKIEHY